MEDSQMRPLFKNLFLVGLLATAVACSDDDNEDNQAENPVNVPTETPGPSPTATPSPMFAWESVRFDQKEEPTMPPAPGDCNGFTRFQVSANGKYSWNDPCTPGGPKSGTITANELGALDALMKGVSREEAATKLVCTQFNDDLTRTDQRVSMSAKMNGRFSLYTVDDDKECVSGNPAEITAIRNSLYELQSKYAAVTIRIVQ